MINVQKTGGPNTHALLNLLDDLNAYPDDDIWHDVIYPSPLYDSDGTDYHCGHCEDRGLAFATNTGHIFTQDPSNTWNVHEAVQDA